jgi:hypothetical protein
MKVWVEGYAPILYHPTPHFFVGLGPDLRTDVMTSTATIAGAAAESNPPLLTVYGLSFTLGGWCML